MLRLLMVCILVHFPANTIAKPAPIPRLIKIDLRAKQVVIPCSGDDIHFDPEPDTEPSGTFEFREFSKRKWLGTVLCLGVPVRKAPARFFTAYYTLTPGDVLPILGRFYRLDKIVDRPRGMGSDFHFTQVTDLVPEKYHVSADTRTIGLTCRHTNWFYKRDGKNYLIGDFELRQIKRVKGSRTEWQAVVEVKFRDNQPEIPAPKPLQANLRAGDLLTAPGFPAYRVVKVVPPRFLDRKTPKAGYLVGWVEISAVPVTKQEQQNDATKSESK